MPRRSGKLSPAGRFQPRLEGLGGVEILEVGATGVEDTQMLYSIKMKRIIFTIVLLSFMVESDAQVFKKVKNIQDYFELIKDEWICDFTRSNKKIVDIRNGYISFRPLDSEDEPLFQMALFKDSKGKDIIVIHSPGYACADIFDCAHTEERKSFFLKYEKEEWVDVSQVVLPQILTEHFYTDSTNAKIVNEYASHAIAYELPQFGQTIRLNLEICDDYINFDEPFVSDEQIEKLLKERNTLLLKWNKRLGVFELGE